MAKNGAWGVTPEGAGKFMDDAQIVPWSSITTGDVIVVTTEQHEFVMEVLSAADHLVRLRGGDLSSERNVRFLGSNLAGGSLISPNNIILGTFMEFVGGLMFAEPALRVDLNGRQVLPQRLNVN